MKSVFCCPDGAFLYKENKYKKFQPTILILFVKNNVENIPSTSF
jgi:hypothetical protein